MGDLTGLIRLHKWRLDERRRALTALEAERDELTTNLTNLVDEYEQEMTLSSQFDAPPPGLAIYIDRSLARQRALEAAIADLERRIDGARSAIASQFQELKKYEIVAEQRQTALALSERRQENARYDEVGITQHLRRKSTPVDGDS